MADRAEAKIAARWAGTFRDALTRAMPALDSLRAYSFSTFRHDLIAGLTVAAVAVPQAMAYAQIAGIPPAYGLYTAIITTIVGAFFSSCKLLIHGPTNAISIAIFSALASVPDERRVALAALLAVMVGLIQILVTALRLGDLTRYISHAVLVGFTLAAGTLIFLSQVPGVLGLSDRGDPEQHFLVRWWQTVNDLRDYNPWSIGLAVLTIVLVLALNWANRRWRLRVPELLSALILAAATVAALGLHDRGVAVVGAIPRRLPEFELPAFDWSAIQELSASALVITLLGLLEALAMAKVLSARTGEKLDINQQCFSEGIANLVGGFFSCFPGSGSLTRSAINHQAGGRTQWSAIFSGVAVAAAMLMFAPLARYVPRAALGGILMITAFRLVDRHRLYYNLRATRFDRGIVIVTALSGVFISIEFCILIGTFLSFVFYVPRAARVNLVELVMTPERVVRQRLPSDRPCGRILIFSLEGELFFGSAPDVEQHLAAIESRVVPGIRVVVLRLKRARNPDAVCLELFEQFFKNMERKGVAVLLSGVRHDMARVLENVGLAERVGRERIFREYPSVWSSTLEAVRHAYQIIGDDLCEHCPKRQEKMHDEETWYYMI